MAFTTSFHMGVPFRIRETETTGMGRKSSKWNKNKTGKSHWVAKEA